MPSRIFTVTAPDGVELSVHEAGDPDAPGIVFIHGFSQSRLSWRRQMPEPSLPSEYRLSSNLPRGRVAADARWMQSGTAGEAASPLLPEALGSAFHLVAYDLRGHGGSGKPLERDAYRNDQVWADDLAAVMAATKVRRPVLVAWSYAGRVVSDYIRHHGQAGIAGVNYVGAVTKSDRAFWGPGLRHTITMCSDDLATSLHASRRFVHACFGGKPVGDELELTLAYTMLSPPPVRARVLDRTRNDGDVLPQITVPVLVSHGALDRVILPAAGHYTAQAVPNARLSLYGGVGHSPFFEHPGRFNRELADFANAAQAP